MNPIHMHDEGADCDCPRCPVCNEFCLATKTAEGGIYPPGWRHFAVTLCNRDGAYFQPEGGAAIKFRQGDLDRLHEHLGVLPMVSHWAAYLVGVLHGARRATANMEVYWALHPVVDITTGPVSEGAVEDEPGAKTKN